MASRLRGRPVVRGRRPHDRSSHQRITRGASAWYADRRPPRGEDISIGAKLRTFLSGPDTPGTNCFHCPHPPDTLRRAYPIPTRLAGTPPHAPPPVLRLHRL